MSAVSGQHPGFCDECDFSNDLHPSWPDDDPSEWDCEVAASKASTIFRFYSLGGPS